MSAIQFKHVGVLKSVQRIEEDKEIKQIPINVVTPLKKGRNQILATNSDLAVAVSDNLKNLILTNWGERLGKYTFGSNLKPLLSDFVSTDDFDSEATIRIKSSVNKWMPYVSLETFSSKTNYQENKNSNGTAAIDVSITYSVPNIKAFNQVITITLYVM